MTTASGDGRACRWPCTRPAGHDGLHGFGLNAWNTAAWPRTDPLPAPDPEAEGFHGMPLHAYVQDDGASLDACAYPGCSRMRRDRSHAIPAPGGDGRECKWASSFLTQCHAVTVSAPEHHRLRCELVRYHEGPHRRERGMYDIAWTDETWAQS